MIQRYEDRQKIIRVNGDYFQVDPTSWKNDLDVNIEVGLGYGDQDVRLNNLSSFANVVEKIGTQVLV